MVSRYISSNFASLSKKFYQLDKMVHGRNEPCTLIQILEVVATIKDISEKELSEIVWRNSCKVLGFKI
jgi:TatD DNase family protein